MTPRDRKRELALQTELFATPQKIITLVSVSRIPLVLTIDGFFNAVDRVVSSVERQIPDEFCKNSSIKTGTNDYAVTVVVAN